MLRVLYLKGVQQPCLFMIRVQQVSSNSQQIILFTFLIIQQAVFPRSPLSSAISFRKEYLAAAQKWLLSMQSAVIFVFRG